MSALAAIGLLPTTAGVLASQHLRKASELGWIDADEFKIPPESIQPASLDLRLGEVAYRLRCSFLPDDQPVEEKVADLVIDELDLRDDGAVLETHRPYLIPLVERLALPAGVRGRANPKSSTGRVDVFTRVVSDRSHRFDEIEDGYHGRLWLEVVPLSFTIRVRARLSLNQLRLVTGSPALSDEEVLAWHRADPLLTRGGEAVPAADLPISGGGLYLSLDLRSGHGPAAVLGHRARDYPPLVDLSRVESHDRDRYWDPVRAEGTGRIVLAPERFYLLLSEESVRIPPGLAGEMTAYDPTSGELRTHYAGFFDPGFGWSPSGDLDGSRAALEVRAHDVPFMVSHGQKVCRLTFERVAAEPDVLYGSQIGSNYQGQLDTVSKHFR